MLPMHEQQTPDLGVTRKENKFWDLKHPQTWDIYVTAQHKNRRTYIVFSNIQLNPRTWESSQKLWVIKYFCVVIENNTILFSIGLDIALRDAQIVWIHKFFIFTVTILFSNCRDVSSRQQFRKIIITKKKLTQISICPFHGTLIKWLLLI